MNDLLLEKFENSVLVQKETSQILGGRKIISSEICNTTYSDGSTLGEEYLDYDSGPDFTYHLEDHNY